eukprot:4607839-Pyramimonas_sp.AAC.1
MWMLKCVGPTRRALDWCGHDKQRAEWRHHVLVTLTICLLETVAKQPRNATAAALYNMHTRIDQI